MKQINLAEKKLIKLIKTVPIILIIIFSIIITYIVLSNNIQKHEQNIANIKQTFIDEQKYTMKNEVLRVVRQINYQKNLAENKLKKTLHEKTNLAYNIITNIYNNNPSKSNNEILTMINDAIRTIRFNNGRGYFFIYTMEGKNLLLPPLPHYEGNNMWNHQDKKGLYTIRELSKISKSKGEGYLNWYWYKPNDNTQMFRKIGFVKYIKPLNIFIGTGEYVKDFEDEIKKELIKEIQEIRYSKNGYIFIHQYDGLSLVHIKKNYIGKKRLDVQTGDGRFIIKEIIDVAKKGEGFLEYIGTIMPTTGKPARKISYIYGIDDWQWQIGTGAYLSEIDEVLLQKEKLFKVKLRETISQIIIISIFLTLILIFILWIFSNDIERKFLYYRNLLYKSNKDSKQKDKLLFEQAKLVSMGEMIGNIAHQWRQPLSIITTATSSLQLQKSCNILTDSTFNDSCEIIINNAQYLSKTIDDFRDFIKNDIEKTTFDLTNDIESFLLLVKGTTNNNNINIVLNLEKDITINGYPNVLMQCLINIFNNSKDALIDNNTDNRLILITTLKDTNNENVIIEITDNAGGIPQDILLKIFEPYFTTKHQSKGTGLGLHMTFNLVVEGMNGTIEADNVDFIHKGLNCTGAQFKIVLPLN